MNRQRCAAVLVPLWFLLTTSPMFAQDPAQLPADPPPPPREVTAEFSFVGTSGNASTSALGLGGEYISRLPAPWEFRGRVGYVNNTSEGELKAESVAALVRANRPISERLSAFGEYGYLRDPFAGIDSRNVVDGGISWAVVRPRPHQLDVDAAVGYAHENRVLGEHISTAQGLLGAHYKVFLSETADITDDVLHSFSLSDSSDWRTNNIVALTAKVTTVFSLKVSNTVRFVNAPLEGFETTDTITSVALVAKF